MPLSAACSVLTALDIESNRPLRSLARLFSDCAVKKLVGLSRAELTRLPVERRTWVCEMRSPVACKLSRFERTPADSTMADMSLHLSGRMPYWPLDTCRSRRSVRETRRAVVMARKRTQLRSGNLNKILDIGADPGI